MSTEISPFIDVRARAIELGCAVPDGLALLPRDFDTATRRDELVHDASGLSVRAAWRADGVEETRLEPDGELWPATQQDSAAWVGPIIFVGSTILSQDPNAINVGLGVVANYVTDLLRGLPKDKQTVQLSVVVEAKEEPRRIDYEGPVEGLADLPEVIRAMRDQ